MSIVTGLTLIYSVCEQIQWDERPPANIELINQWLTSRHFDALVDVADEASGGKHPQCYVYIAGYNNFTEDDFSDYFLTLEWEMPECAVLVLQPEDGATRVFRPSYTQHPTPP